jgi:PAS domain S-box-containing protein
MKLNSLKSIHLRRTGIAYVVLVVTLLLTAITTLSASRMADAKDQLRFDNAVGRTQEDIQNRLDTYIVLLRGSQGLFAASDNVSLRDFRAYVNSLELRRRYPGIQGIGFSVRVNEAEKEGLIAQMGRQGRGNFAIRPDFPRPEYYVIAYLEPLDRRNQAAIGFDMFTEPMRRAAMEQARDTAAAAASGQVTLMQEIDEQKQSGFLIYLPIYRDGIIPDTVAERREALIGFVYSPFRADDLLTGIFGTQKNPVIDFQVYDGITASPEKLLYRSNPNRRTGSFFNRPHFTTKRTIDVAGRPWTLLFTSRPEIGLLSERRLMPYIGLSGVVISLVLFGVTRSQAQARTAAERSAANLRDSEAALRESEKRFRRLVESNMFGVTFGDLNGGIHYANDYFLQLVGYDWEALLAGQVNWKQMTPSEFLALDEKAIAELKTQGIATPFEKEYIRRDGSHIPILFGGAILEEPFIQQEAIGFYLDISDRKKAEKEREQLLLREQQYSRQLHGLTEAALAVNSVLSVDESLKVITERARSIIGAHQAVTSMTVGENWAQAINAVSLSDKYAEWQDYEELTDGSGIYTCVCHANRPMRLTQAELEAHPRWNGFGDAAHRHPPMRGWLAAPLKGRDGHNIGLVQLSDKYQGEFTQEDEAILVQLAQMASIAIENTRLYEAEQSARTQAERANRLKDEFLAVLSHELRTPLNPILGWAKLLRRGQLSEQTTARALETIERNAQLQTQLIEDLLDISRILQGKLSLKVSTVNLVSAITAALETVHLAAVAKSITLETNLDPTVGQVSGDPGRLQQIIWNLLSNSVKFTPSGGKVTIQLEAVDAYAKITVSDTGKGIEPDFLPYVFDYFRQEDSATTRTFGGLGLGLAIVRQLVELHGGMVWAESSGVGQGATFCVQFPLIPASSPIDSEPMPSCAAPDLRGIRLLVVDDDADSLELLVFSLEKYGAEVMAASSAKQALSVLKQSTSDLLISDVGMPEMDGYMLISQVRALAPEAGGDIPAIALTAYASESDSQQALFAGFTYHVSKPVEPAKLASLIAERLRS